MIRYSLAVLSLLTVSALSLSAQTTQLVWNPTSVSFVSGAGSTVQVTAKATLINSGSTPLAFQLSESADWLTISPSSGNLGAGSNTEITLTADPTGLSTGLHTALVVAVGSLGGGSVFLPVEIDISGLSIQTTPASMSFDPVKDGTQTKLLEVRYSDGERRPATWTVTTLSGGDWLKVGSAPPQSVPLDLGVTVDATGMQAGETHRGEITFYSPEASFLKTVVPVQLTVYSGPLTLTVIPEEVRYYVFGPEVIPPQPIQVLDRDGRFILYNVTKDPADSAFTFPQSALETPSTFALGVNAAQLGQLPRRDKVTFQPTQGERPTIVPVYGLEEPRRVNTIAQVADGGAFRTQITVTNLDTVPAVVSLRFHRAPGETGATTPWNLAMEGDPATQNVSIPVGGSYTVRTTGAGTEVNQGWGEVVSNQKVGGTAVFEFTQPDGRVQEAAVPITNTLMQRLLLPFDNSAGFVTGIAIVNKHSSETCRITAVVRDPQGKVIKIAPFPSLPALGHRAFELARLFPDLAGLRGTLELNATSGNLHLLGLRFNPVQAFTSFEPQTLNRRPASQMMSIPQIVDGQESITEITLINHSASVARVTLKFYRDTADGATTPWDLQLVGRNSFDPIDIPVGSSVTLRTTGLGGTLGTGWASVESSSWVTGSAVYRLVTPGRPDQEATVPINFGSPVRQVLPFDNSGPFTTSVAVVNRSATQPGNFNVIARDPSGARIALAPIPTIPPQGHRAFRIEDLSPLLSDKRGTIEFSTVSGEISVIGLRFLDSGAFTSIKSNVVQ